MLGRDERIKLEGRMREILAGKCVYEYNFVKKRLVVIVIVSGGLLRQVINVSFQLKERHGGH